MQILVADAVCEVCGESAPCTQDTATAAWFKGSFIAHGNPRICAENLKAKQEKEKALKDATDPRQFS
jgi:hypothetical protein